jgi:hypothetical protein
MSNKTNPFRPVARLLWERVLRERKDPLRRRQPYWEHLVESAIIDAVAMVRENPNLTDEQVAIQMKELLEVETLLDRANLPKTS